MRYIGKIYTYINIYISLSVSIYIFIDVYIHIYVCRYLYVSWFFQRLYNLLQDVSKLTYPQKVLWSICLVWILAGSGIWLRFLGSLALKNLGSDHTEICGHDSEGFFACNLKLSDSQPPFWRYGV